MTDDRDEEIMALFGDFFDKHGRQPTVEEVHAAILQIFEKQGLPADLVSLDVLRFRRAITAENDRGAGLFAAAYIDARLRVLLGLFLVDDKKVANPLFEGTGSLHAFSSRIDIAYLLGLIAANVRRDLHIIRKIRNDFAHSADAILFADEPTKSRCRSLRRVKLAVDVNSDDAPRMMYVQASMMALGVIDGTIDRLKRGEIDRRTVKPDALDSDPEDVRSGVELIAMELLGGGDPSTGS